MPGDDIPAEDASEPTYAFDVHCGAPLVVHWVADGLRKHDCHLRYDAPVKLIIDIPLGFAAQTIQRLANIPDRASAHLLTVTFSCCVEYWLDLLDLQPDILLVNPKRSTELRDAVVRAHTGERFHSVPETQTRLSDRERVVLRLLAQRRDTADIARQLALGEKTVTNILTSIYTKLEVEGRVEAILYYWGKQFPDDDPWRCLIH